MWVIIIKAIKHLWCKSMWSNP